MVEKLHRLAAEHSGESVTLIAGDPSHPEVVGIAGYCEGETHVFRSAEELDKIIPILVMVETGPSPCLHRRLFRCRNGKNV